MTDKEILFFALAGYIGERGMFGDSVVCGRGDGRFIVDSYKNCFIEIGVVGVPGSKYGQDTGERMIARLIRDPSASWDEMPLSLRSKGRFKPKTLAIVGVDGAESNGGIVVAKPQILEPKPERMLIIE